MGTVVGPPKVTTVVVAEDGANADAAVPDGVGVVAATVVVPGAAAGVVVGTAAGEGAIVAASVGRAPESGAVAVGGGGGTWRRG